MNTYTLESFISFCDVMMIANEGFNLKDIKEKIIRSFKKLLDKIKEFMLKCTKNKEVAVNPDFFNKFNKIEKEINGLKDKIDDEYITQRISYSNYENHERINRLINDINYLEEIDIYVDDFHPSELTMNTYKIFKKLNNLKDRLEKRLNYMKKIVYDEYSDEFYYDNIYVEVFTCEVELYVTAYKKLHLKM